MRRSSSRSILTGIFLLAGVASGQQLPSPYLPPAPALQQEGLDPAGTLTLGDALALTAARNPELAAAEREVQAREGRILQAGTRPNPALSLEVENIGGDSLTTGGMQSTLQLGQLIELGGERTARLGAARASRELARWELESLRLEVFTRLTKLFIDVLFAQRNLTLADESVRLSEEVAGTVSERVDAGKVSPIEQTRAEVGVAAERIERGRAGADLEAARTRLAAMWASTAPRFEAVSGDLDALPAIPSFEAVLGKVENNPDLARWASEIAEREALVQLERARAVPDVTVAGGYREFELGSSAAVVTATVPLPLFDRNRGARQEARERLAVAEENRRAANVRVRQLLAESYAALTRAEAEVRSVREQIVPGAESVFAAVSEGYRLGKFGYLEVLDARSTLATARTQLARAQADLHRAVADLERLSGAPITEMTMESTR